MARVNTRKDLFPMGFIRGPAQSAAIAAGRRNAPHFTRCALRHKAIRGKNHQALSQALKFPASQGALQRLAFFFFRAGSSGLGAIVNHPPATTLACTAFLQVSR
jgi:hypothetical protein